MSWWIVAFEGGGSPSGSVIASQRVYAPWGGGMPYPRTVGGVTMGPPGTDGIASAPATGWVSGNDPVLRGRWQVDNSITATYRFDLPFAGRTVDIILGLSGQNFQRNRVRLWDGDVATGEQFFDFSGQNTGDGPPGGTFDQWMDFTSGGATQTTWRAMDADVLDPLPTVRQRVFTNSFVTVQLGAHASEAFQSQLSFIALREVSVAPPLVANAYRLIPGTFPDSPVAGTPYTLRVEAIDTTQGNARVTTHTDSAVTLGEDVAFPNLYEIVSGTVTRAMILAGAGTLDFPSIVFGAIPTQLTPPSLAAGSATDTSTQRSVPITVTPGSGWPGGVTTQLQTRRGSTAFANTGSPVTTSGTLTFARESAAYTVDVRGIASVAGGVPADSAPSAVLTITVPALAPAALAAPSLVAGVPVDTSTQRTVVVTVTGPSGWPSGVTTQLQTRRGSAAFADNGAAVASAASLTFARESAAYSVQVRGIARVSGGVPADSEPSGVLTIAVPALVTIPSLTTATPLRCTVQLYPSTSQAVDATGGGGIPSLLARTDSDHVLRIRTITNMITGAVTEPTDLRYRVEDDTGLLIGATVTAPTAPDDWRIPLARQLFAADRGPMLLVLTLVATDASETVLQFTLAQGVQQ
jgi:hypothetical protein